jgi:hypothetical protein
VTLYGQRYVGFWYIRQKYPDMNGEQLFFFFSENRCGIPEP